jgi:type IV pilus assembly protein PilQ
VYRKWLLIVGLIVSFSSAFAGQTFDHSVSLDINNINLREALSILAQKMNRAIVLSPTISGNVSLHFKNIMPEQAFQFLLESHGLQAWQRGNIWYITTMEKLIKQQEEQSKWRETLENTVSLVTQVWQVHYAKVDDIAHWLKDEGHSWLSKRGRLYIDTRANILCIEDTKKRIATIQYLLKKLDVPVKQVLIEARLASIDSDYEQELGIDFTAINNEVTGEVKTEALNKPRHFSLAVSKLADNSLIDIKLVALENQGHAQLISSPSLFTASHQMASIEAGEEIPYQESTSSGATAVVFKKAVLSLKVTPQILPSNKVLLKLQVNQDRPSAHTILGVPAISTRQIVSNVLVANGHTIVLGGIFESNRENAAGYLPFLGKIPGLGWLFGVQSQRERKRELLVFVTPKIVE